MYREKPLNNMKEGKPWTRGIGLQGGSSETSTGGDLFCLQFNLVFTNSMECEYDVSLKTCWFGTKLMTTAFENPRIGFSSDWERTWVSWTCTIESLRWNGGISSPGSLLVVRTGPFFCRNFVILLTDLRSLEGLWWHILDNLTVSRVTAGLKAGGPHFYIPGE